MRKIAVALALLAGCRNSAPAPAPVSAPPPAAAKVAIADAGANDAACCSREDMRADLTRLQELLESSHPDPYGRAGGADAFRARFADAERELPATLDPQAFYLRLRPLLAQVRDGHTNLRPPAVPNERRVLVGLDIVEERLVVRAVYDESARATIGGVITAVEGAPVATLIERMKERRGYDNAYTNLWHLSSALTRASSLEDLVGHPVGATARFAVGAGAIDARVVGVGVGAGADAAALRAETKIALPEKDVTGIGSGFLGKDAKASAVLRIDSAMEYREAFEVWRATGFNGNLGAHLDGVVRAATKKESLEGMSLDDKIRAVPSFTERLEELVTEMKRRGTPQLVVDLRENEGGNSVFASILEYFLYPLDAVLSADHGYQVPRYSALYFANHTADSLEKVRARTRPDFALGDSDTAAEEKWKASRGKKPSPEDLARDKLAMGRLAKMVPTFDAALTSGKWNAAWKGRVVVLTSARTYSAGFDAVLDLRALGAKVVGVPPAQAANCFIDSLAFELPRSHLVGSISYKRSLGLPADPKNGELLRPDVELTYEAWQKRAFDPNAAYDLVAQAR
ncbi:MAG: hypothetical protein KIT84_01435 [Labilithrix sp.]|nr:hypothetical protein [Labilithrix sp.]MCW5809649.1 hypothetical protein [Labilithrix sp.]